MNTGAKIAIGAGLLGGAALLWWSSSKVTEQKKLVVGRAQDLLAFFNRNQGLDITARNAEQNSRIAGFQTAWNASLPFVPPLLRTDGVWDSNTQTVFRQVTGFTPPMKSIPLQVPQP